jgi:hypothetical protein
MRLFATVFNGFYEIILFVLYYVKLLFTELPQGGFRKGISRAVKAEVQRLKLGAYRLYAFLSLKYLYLS